MHLRTAEPADIAWCFAVYEDLMQAPTVALVGHWSPTQRAVVDAAVRSGHTQIITVGADDVGWFYVARQPDHNYLHQLYVARAWQGRGIGTRVLAGLLAEGREVRLAVMRNNPGAERLYARLGFTVLHEDRLKRYLRWQPREPPR